MKAVIDTSSLLSLVRYYIPFDQNGILFSFIKKEIEQHNLIIIDEVLNECINISKGLVIKKLDYLNNKVFIKKHKIPFKTNSLLPPAPEKFYRMVDNNFTAPIARRLNSIQYEQQKEEFLKSADARMIILVLNEIKNNPEENIIIITEETESSNDRKPFKKIPTICKYLDIEVQTLPELLTSYKKINVEIK